MTIKKRFEDTSTLTEALMAQRFVQGDGEIVKALVASGELKEFAAGENLIEEGATDRDMYLLLAGKVKVLVRNQQVASRERNEAVGEMSAVNPVLVRSATIQAEELTVALRISHETLNTIGTHHPRIWKLLAQQLASRLEQRNRFVSQPNERPRVFLICSAEALDIAETIRADLQYEKAVVEIWSDSHIFPAGGYPLEALEQSVAESDFGIAIAQPDDLVRSRDRKSMTPRDNVVFELGFFMSKLGRKRTILMVPNNEDVKLPSDFKGLTPLGYNTPTDKVKASTALGPAVHQIKLKIRELGVRKGYEN